MPFATPGCDIGILEACVQILIIDDSHTMRGILRRTLEKLFEGCIVREAEDGKSAIHELALGRVDLIITDLEMPGMDGRRFLETLRQNPLLRKKKIVVFSSAIEDSLTQQFKDNPNVAFLAKPASHESIAQAIGLVMGESQATL